MLMTNMATLQNFEVSSDKFNKVGILVDIMQRNGSLNCVIITL